MDAFLKGSVPGANAAFLPRAPVLAAECRRQMNLRLDSEHRRRAVTPALPAPTIEHSPDSQARVGELVRATVAGLKRVTEEADGDQTKHRAEGWARTNASFMPDMDEREMERRLGFVIGDDEGQADAA